MKDRKLVFSPPAALETASSTARITNGTMP
jgi:hypothetical protein